MKVLLVDDEPRVIDGIRRILRHALNASWQVATATSGAEALDKIKQEPPDILVTDMRMPKMNGAQLLKRVHDEYPDTVRIVLSGQMDEAAALCAVPHAHQFLAKPCETTELLATLHCARVLRRLLGDGDVRRAAGDANLLPACPSTYSALRAALAVPDTPSTDIVRIVASDPALAAKALQLVNGGCYRTGRRSPTCTRRCSGSVRARFKRCFSPSSSSRRRRATRRRRASCMRCATRRCVVRRSPGRSRRRRAMHRRRRSSASSGA